MGTVTITTNSVGATNAWITCEAKGFSLPASTATTIYSDIRYEWAINGAKKTTTYSTLSHEITNLSPGSSANCQAWVDVYCTQTIKATDGTTTSETSWYSLGGAGSSIAIYTQPGPWTRWDNLKEGQIVEDVLKAEDWNNLLEQCKKWKRWESQSANISVVDCSVEPGAIITAEIYMNMAKNCCRKNQSPQYIVTGGDYGTIMRPEHFQVLAERMSPD